MANLYRVYFTMELLVEAEDSRQATAIAEDNFINEAANGTAEIRSVMQVKHPSELLPSEKGSYPWRSFHKMHHPDLQVEQILEANKNETR